MVDFKFSGTILWLPDFISRVTESAMKHKFGQLDHAHEVSNCPMNDQ
jgi:hypothetical protein